MCWREWSQGCWATSCTRSRAEPPRTLTTHALATALPGVPAAADRRGRPGRQGGRVGTTLWRPVPGLGLGVGHGLVGAGQGLSRGMKAFHKGGKGHGHRRSLGAAGAEVSHVTGDSCSVSPRPVPAQGMEWGLTCWAWGVGLWDVLSLETEWGLSPSFALFPVCARWAGRCWFASATPLRGGWPMGGVSSWGWGHRMGGQWPPGLARCGELGAACAWSTLVYPPTARERRGLAGQAFLSSRGTGPCLAPGPARDQLLT